MTKIIGSLPIHFSLEKKKLSLKGIETWDALQRLTDFEIHKLVREEKCKEINLKKLRGIAILIYELSITQEEAALLIHSGVSSSIALSQYSPQRLIHVTGRFERQLNLNREPLFDLKKANLLIALAKKRQISN